MHPATLRFLPALDRRPHSALTAALLRAVALDGTEADVPALLDPFLADPAKRGGLVVPLTLLGDADTARRLLAACTADGRLRPDMPPELLWCFGWHGLTEAEPLLFQEVGGEDWFAAREACLGLLHLPCADLRPAIRAAILDCGGQHLFPEFLPALAGKTGDPDLLDWVLKHGRETASVDCMGGVVLAAALSGDPDRFRSVLWDPAFAAGDGSTGTALWSELGLRLAGLSLSGLYAELKARIAAGTGDPVYQLHLFLSLLEQRALDRLPKLRFAPPPEPFLDIYAALFHWSDPNRDDSLNAFAAQILGDLPYAKDALDNLRELQERLLLRVEEEVRFSAPREVPAC